MDAHQLMTRLAQGVAVAVFGLCLAAAAAQDAGNLLANPGFEDADAQGKANGWTLPQPVYAIAADVARSGTRSLRYINDDAARYPLASTALPYEAGARYEFEVWVRTRGVQGEDTGATVCLEWYDAAGGYLGGAYPPGVKGTQDTWTRVHGISGQTPDKAARCSVTCYVRKGMTGTAWFDDVAVRRYYPPLLSGMTADRHRAEYAGGPAEVLVGVEASEGATASAAVEIDAAVLDSAGNTVAQPTVERRQDGRLAALHFDTTPLAPGTYQVRAVASTLGGARRSACQMRLRRLAEPRSRAVTIDEFGRTLVDGKPFFPLGTYWSSVTEEHLRLYAASPFNCLMPYGSPRAEQMDLIEGHGLKVIYSIKDCFAGTQWCPKSILSEADERPAIEKIVSAVRGHRALLGWYLNDELPVEMMPRLAAHQDWLEELDPDHPTWVVLYQVDDVRRYLPSFDVIGTDPYPIPQKPASMALEWTRRTHQGCFGRRAVWQVPQIFDWGAYRKGDEAAGCRPPTLPEMRSMAWQCIAGGANGLIFYSWFDLWKMNDKDPFDRRWAEVTAMAQEIRQRFPVLLLPGPAPAVTVAAPADVGWRLWGAGKEIHILAVNSGTAPVEALVTLPGVPAAVECELGEGSGSADGVRLKVALGPLEPRMLKVTLKP